MENMSMCPIVPKFATPTPQLLKDYQPKYVKGMLHTFMVRVRDSPVSLRNPYCEIHVELTVEAKRWRKHLGLQGVEDPRDEFLAQVSSINSFEAQEAGILPGMFLVGVNDTNIAGFPYAEVLAMLDEVDTHHVTLFFRDTAEQDRASSARGSPTSSPVMTPASSRKPFSQSQLHSELVGKLSCLTSPTTSSGRIPTPLLMSEDSTSLGSGNVALSVGCVEDASMSDMESYWPRYMQYDEYLVTFRTKPLGIRVEQDSRGLNAIVKKVKGKHAKASGVQKGSMIYSINGEGVQELPHEEVLEKLKEATLPLNIVFWHGVPTQTETPRDLGDMLLFGEEEHLGRQKGALMQAFKVLSDTSSVRNTPADTADELTTPGSPM